MQLKVGCCNHNYGGMFSPDDGYKNWDRHDTSSNIQLGVSTITRNHLSFAITHLTLFFRTLLAPALATHISCMWWIHKTSLYLFFLNSLIQNNCLRWFFSRHLSISLYVCLGKMLSPILLTFHSTSINVSFQYSVSAKQKEKKIEFYSYI